MKKHDAVKMLLGDRQTNLPSGKAVEIFSPANIALCKYWGKRNQELNLPVTGSLSVSLNNKGTTTTLKISENQADEIYLNGQLLDAQSAFAVRLTHFLNLFRTQEATHFYLDICTNIPIAAGLASSASGFASLIHALNALFQWQLSSQQLSILARLGSGSASRSIMTGFVEWYRGMRDDGNDSFADRLPAIWPELCVGLLIVNDKEKLVSSREAMQTTLSSSPLYSLWPNKVAQDLLLLKNAIHTKEFDLLGKVAESNAMTMHATMLAAWPPISYAMPETVLAMQKIWKLRRQGLALYFTQDAGPNLKLLFLEENIATIREYFPEIDIVRPFD